jgi:hypothetical protein
MDTEHFERTFLFNKIADGNYFIKITIDNKTKYEKIIIKKMS